MMREMGASALREQWTEQAASIGMTVEEILHLGKSAVAATARRRHEHAEHPRAFGH